MKKTKKPFTLLSFQRHVASCMKHKYTSKEHTHIYINTNNLIFNETCHIVARFKDYLILDDSTEFLRRFYAINDSVPRLKKIFLFFETYSKLFPNYMILPESTYLYKNIRKKQKMIDAVNEIKREEEENRRQIIQNKKVPSSSQFNQNKFFTNNIQNSINKYHPSINNSFYDKHNDSSISISLISRKRTSFFEYEHNDNNNNINNNIQHDETNLSIIDILSNINPHTNSKKEIIVRSKKQNNNNNNNCVYYNNQLLETPRKGKQFIQKIICGQNVHFIKSPNKSKSQQIIPTSPGNVKYIYNNYQNIIIPQGKGNTVININNNYYQYAPSRQVHKIKSPTPSNKKNEYTKWNTQQIKIHQGLMSPQPTIKTTTIYKRTTQDNSGTVSNSSHNNNNIRDNDYNNQMYKSPNIKSTTKKGSMFKTEYHNVNLSKFNKGITGTTLFPKAKTNSVYKKKHLQRKGVSESKSSTNVMNAHNPNNNINNSNNIMKGNECLHKKQKSQGFRTLTKSQTYLVVNVDTKQLVTSPKKKREELLGKEKLLTTAMKNKYKAFLRKAHIDNGNISNRNTSELEIKQTKSKSIMSHSGSNVNINKSISCKKKKGNVIQHHCKVKSCNHKGSSNMSVENKGETFSPKNSNGLISSCNNNISNSCYNNVGTCNNNKYASFEGKTPVALKKCEYKIRVNRKVFLDKLKNKIEEDDKEVKGNEQ